MGTVIKGLFLLAFLAVLGLVGYAYLGPVFGVDFTAPREEIRQPVVLDVD